MSDACLVGDGLARHVEHDAAVVDTRHAVGYAFQIAGDMAGQQHAARAVGGKVAQTIEHLVAGNGVKPGSGLIENKQVSVV